MKVVFFDVDSLTKKYIEKNSNCNCKIIMCEKSLSTLTKVERAKYEDADIISIFSVSADVLGASILEHFPKLKLIATRSTGFDHIDIKYCKNRNIAVVNVPKYGEATVAEYAMGLLLNLSRKIILVRNDMYNGHYEVKNYIGFDLYGRTIGIIGTGAIGRHMIKLAKGFGMEVLAYDLFPNAEVERIMGFKYVNLDDIYHKSDIISLHAPSTKENFHLLNKTAFEKMKKDVIIINTARGDLIDTEELYRAIIQGKVAGAGLDVLEDEETLIYDDIFIDEKPITMDFALNTIINNKLLRLPNVIITPHTAFNSIDAVNRILATTIKNIESFSVGRLVNSVIK